MNNKIEDLVDKYILIHQLVDKYLDQPENPDWGGLIEALKNLGYSSNKVYLLCRDIRYGAYQSVIDSSFH